MKKHFYTHLIEISSIEARLLELPLADHECHELILIVHETIHHVVVDTVMSELSEEDKKAFLHHIGQDDHDSVWILLKGRIDNIEEKIKSAVTKHTKELHEDMKDLHDNEI